MNFENTVSRYRKVSEMVDELKEYANTLAAERDSLEAGIIATCSKDPSLYNVFRRKTGSAGIVGRNMFTVTFSEQLERIKANKRLDDQEWLAKTDFAQNTGKWVGTKLFLRTSKVVADYKCGATTLGELEHFGLCLGRCAHVTAKRIPNDAELEVLRSTAEALIDEIGA